MPTVRLFQTADERTIQSAGRILEAEFDDDSYPVSRLESQDEPGTWLLSIFVPGNEADAVRERSETRLEEAGFTIVFDAETLGDIDWVSQSLADLPPVRAGRFVVAGDHARAAVGPGEIGIIVNAGQAFGTGHHGTTAGCLVALGDAFNRRRYANALDLGTGSGVLAIAMARAQPLCVLATDIDPLAVAIARENAKSNGVASRIECMAADAFRNAALARAKPFDLVCANILAGTLTAMARDLRRMLAPGATVILSGILPHQRAGILSAYVGQGLALQSSHFRDGWVTLVFGFSIRPKKQRISFPIACGHSRRAPGYHHRSSTTRRLRNGPPASGATGSCSRSQVV